MWHKFKWCDEVQVLHIDSSQVVWCNYPNVVKQVGNVLILTVVVRFNWLHNTFLV